MDIGHGRIFKKGFRAQEYKGREPEFRGRIVVERSGTGGLVEFPDFEQFIDIAYEERIPEAAVDRAFGHMLHRNESKPPTAPEAMPGAEPFYGQSRRIKLGHYVASDRAAGIKGGVRPGIRKGDLVLYEELPGGRKLVHFLLEEIPEEEKNAGKLRNKEGRVLTISSALNKGRKLGIPMQALLQAFGHLLPRTDLRELSKAIRR